MKIIFLDIDGVLNSWQSRREDGQLTIDSMPCANLLYIIGRTGAEIVLTSTWRRNSAMMEIAERLFEEQQIPRWIDVLDTDYNTTRTQKIQRWIKKNHEEYDMKSFVILDDELMGTPLKKYHVQTDDMMFGLKKSEASRAVVVLKP